MDPVDSSRPDIPRNAARWLAFGPYYGMFPIRFALNVVEEYTQPGDALLDPFAGRGTSIAAAWALGRRGTAVEVNPVAWLYGRVKIAPAPEGDVLRRLADVTKASEGRSSAADDLCEFYRLCFSQTVRRFLLAARDLLDWKSEPADQTLMAFILAYLHGKWGQALSNQMRQQKSMAPAYSVRWWKERKMEPPDVDPHAFLTQRVKWRYAWGTISGFGDGVVLGDAREVLRDSNRPEHLRARLLLTSPPYCGLTSYYYDHWLRYWMLGGPSLPTRVGEKWRSESRQGNRERYVDLLTSVFRDSARLLTPDATVYVRTDRREFTRQTTSDALHAAFPDHHMQTVESPYTRHTQTALFGDKEMKPGEVDLVLTKSSNSAQPHADGASAAAV